MASTRGPVFSDKDMRLLESRGTPSFSQVVVVSGAQDMKHFSSAVLPSSTCEWIKIDVKEIAAKDTCLLEKEENISGA